MWNKREGVSFHRAILDFTLLKDLYPRTILALHDFNRRKETLENGPES
jgi:hypothetical protein